MERASLQPLPQMGLGKGSDDLSALSFSSPMCKHEGTELWTTFGSTLESVCLSSTPRPISLQRGMEEEKERRDTPVARYVWGFYFVVIAPGC